MLKRILVGLAGTEYTEVAIQRALELATLHDAQVTGVTVLDPTSLPKWEPVPIGAGAVASQYREHRQHVTRSRVEEAASLFVDLCTTKGVRHELYYERGNPFEQMFSYSRYHDLTVFGLRSVFEYYFKDQDSSVVLEGLIRGGMRPVVAVPREFRPIQRVLIAYSGSMESAKAMRRFVQLGLWPQVEIQVVTFDRCNESPTSLLDQAASYCRAHGFEVDTKHIAQPAKSSLLSHANAWGADLIVMGNSERSLLMKRILGETALHAMRHSTQTLFLAQ